MPLSRAEDAAAAGPTLTVGPRSIDGTDTSIKTSSSRRPPIHRGACGGVAEVECRVYEEPLVGDGTGSCRCFQLTEHAHAAQSHHINELWFALCALPEQLESSGKQHACRSARSHRQLLSLTSEAVKSVRGKKSTNGFHSRGRACLAVLFQCDDDD